jgi:hypothetical protein
MGDARAARMRRMRTLYQAANAVEAHILQGYLQH